LKKSRPRRNIVNKKQSEMATLFAIRQRRSSLQRERIRQNVT